MQHHTTFVEGLTAILARNNVIKAADAQRLAQDFYNRSQERFDEFLLSEGLVTPEDLLQALSQYYAVPYFDVQGYFFSHFMLHKFPKDFLIANCVIPIELDNETLILAANNPDDEDLLTKIGEHVSYDLSFRVGISRHIIDAIEEYYDLAVTEIPEDEDLREERREQEEQDRIATELDEE